MKRLVVLLFSICITATLYSYNWNADGYTVIPPEEGIEPGPVVELLSPGGKKISIRNEQLVTSEHAETIKDINAMLFGFEHIEIDSVIYDIRSGSIRVLAVPSSFVYNERDMLENVTAGMSFFYQSGALKYNFRIKLRNMYIRIDGVYIDEESLCQKIEEALNDPQGFIARRDSEYLLQKITNLEQKIRELEAVDQTLRENDRTLQETDRTLMRNDRVIVSNIRKLQEESRTEDEKIRTAQLAYHNNEVLAGDKPIAKEIVQKVLEIHKNNPSLDLDGIEERCKELELEVSKKEINMILITYENIFQEK